jgi:hypothetical protein
MKTFDEHSFFSTIEKQIKIKELHQLKRFIYYLKLYN